ncbi:MAG: hypothetical protein QMD85_02405 [Candidatus Aenigmarchaeota archaeon]|nr:hypothetical protein [Candidatus Aenigmarchaeota archaeon]MDI6722391.1 hypothetical protein [Candidatus Aenigmarchaeota archaeon]
MELREKTTAIVAVLIAGALIFFFLNQTVLLAAYILLWADKVLIGSSRMLRRFGMELATISTIAVSFFYGPVNAFIFGIIAIPILHNIKFIFVSPDDDWPPFVPTPYGVIDVVGGSLAFFLRAFGFFPAVILILLLKYILYALTDRMLYEKPVDIISPVMNFILHVILFIPLAKIVFGI